MKDGELKLCEARDNRGCEESLSALLQLEEVRDLTSPRTQTYGYTRGRLTSVPGFATALTYHPSGMVATVVRTNGITDYQRADATGQARPAEIYALRTSDNFGYWTTGAYDYDPSGNVKKTGNALYLYDLLSRVVSGTVYSGPYSNGTASTQS